MTGERYILWDFDGTLAFRMGMWSGALLEVLQAYEGAGESGKSAVTAGDLRPFLASGFRWHKPFMAHPAETPAESWWDELNPIFEKAFCHGAKLAPERARELAKLVRRVYSDPERWQVFPDTKAVLEQLSRQGWKHALLTNHVPELPTILRSLDIDRHFSLIFNSAVTGWEKPHRAAFLHAKANLPACERLWMVGDSLAADIQGAREAGIAAIMVRNTHASVRHCFADLRGAAACIVAKAPGNDS